MSKKRGKMVFNPENPECHLPTELLLGMIGNISELSEEQQQEELEELVFILDEREVKTYE